MQTVEIYTDGACRGNPGPGAWAAVLRYNGAERKLSGTETQTTNNRMELMAAIRALEALKRPCRVRLHTDSRYIRDGITRWLAGWKRNGWKTASRKPVKNRELWERLEQAAARHEVDWRWVRGHAGDPGNELADRLANEALDRLQGR